MLALNKYKNRLTLVKLVVLCALNPKAAIVLRQRLGAEADPASGYDHVNND